MAFQKFSKLDQSLFTRFVRLGTPTFDLNAQGRMRPSLADLYAWRYKGLGNLPNVTAPDTEYAKANGGFVHPFQLVDCGDFHGKGESSPNPYFYQNLGEAEYVVATFQYMRLCGYPADKIAVLTTYNGQKALLKDVFARRCAWHSFFGLPSKITTVDKYQGQQNDCTYNPCLVGGRKGGIPAQGQPFATFFFRLSLSCTSFFSLSCGFATSFHFRCPPFPCSYIGGRPCS
jgi:intron-binding protein aquarius